MIVIEEQTMDRQIILTLLVTLGLASWADAGFAVSIQRAARPVIASTTVDADNNIMVACWGNENEIDAKRRWSVLDCGFPFSPGT